MEKKQRTLYIFTGVLICSFIVQVIPRALVGYFDEYVWADQLQFFLNHDQRMFDFYYCYGHPGTTIIELGIFSHSVLGFSYHAAVTISVSFLIAAATAACSALCFLFFPDSPWWLATALTLSVNRLHIGSTPPTGVVMPFVTLIVLGAWWLWTHTSQQKWALLVWGGVIGISTATRYDVSLLIGMPLFLLIVFRHGMKAVIPVLAGAGAGFVISDPFMWFMPVQHVSDLIHKFTMHYSNFTAPYKIKLDEFINTVWLSTLCFALSLFHMVYQHKRQVIPTPILVSLAFVSILASAVVLTSTYQAIRYLFPLCIVWEVFLPVYFVASPESLVLERFTASEKKLLTQFVITMVTFVQLAAHLISYLYATV